MRSTRVVVRYVGFSNFLFFFFISPFCCSQIGGRTTLDKKKLVRIPNYTNASFTTINSNSNNSKSSSCRIVQSCQI